MSPRRITVDEWRPVGIDGLEPNAMEAVRCDGNACVVAGPGAGKTEFLAQRAAFLLQTGLCRPPFQILAISFKRDAARNLAARVRERCPPDQARRFTSQTFDAFTKALVDRFRSAIPDEWRPPRTYDIGFPSLFTVNTFLGDLQAPRSDWTREIRALRGDDFAYRHFGTWRLSKTRPEPSSGLEYALLRWWDFYAKAAKGPPVTFGMLNRLAELLVRTKPQIGGALRSAYPFVFVDEFQDTTYAQFDLLMTLFHGSRTTLTVVGDTKQRIMVWAGARRDAFDEFETQFSARTFPLLFNFRSSPALVRLQYAVAQALDGTTVEAQSQTSSMISGDVAELWTFSDARQEAAVLAEWLEADRAARGLVPRDYAFVARQKAEVFHDELRPAFDARGLRLRNESTLIGKTSLQDLMGEPLTTAVLSVVELAVQRPAPQAWVSAVENLQAARAIAPENHVAIARVERELNNFLAKLRTDLLKWPPDKKLAAVLLQRVIDFFDLGALARAIPEYAHGDTLAIAREALGKHFVASADRAVSWTEALHRCRGTETSPILTIHKSKGLEYDTVIFLGLDDSTWWNHRPGDSEGMSTFFVALSRAKQRVIFAHCRERGERKRVSDLYTLLQQAGVPERRW